MKRTAVFVVCLGVLSVAAAPVFAQGNGSKTAASPSAPVSPVFRGSAPGSGGAFAPVSPAAIPFHPSIEGRELNEAEPPEHRMPALPNPANLAQPFAPAGANETDDGGGLGVPGFRRLSVSTTAPSPSAGFPGISQTGFIPPDSIIAAGGSHIMTGVNSDFAIFAKNGAKLYQGSADTWFKNVAPSLGTGSLSSFDPQVAYDHFANRWLMVYLATDKKTQSWLLLSVSDGADPTGQWCNVALPGDLNGNTPSATWSDFEGLGFDSQAVYLTTNQYEFNTNPSTHAYSKLRIIRKSQLYGGCTAAPSWYDFWDLRDPATGVKSATLRPAVAFGSSPAGYMVSSSPYVTGTYWSLWTISNAGGTGPTVAGVNVPVTAYSEAPGADQLGGTAGTTNCPAPCYIDTGDTRLLNAVYRNGSLWAAQTVAGGTGNRYSRARYVRISVGSASALEDSSLGLDGCWYYHPAVAVDGSGMLVMAFSRSCTSEYASVRYTVRMPGDPDLESSTALRAGESSYVRTGNGTTGANRWGDYSGAAVDPAEPTAVWLFGEYAASPSNTWGTYIGQVREAATCQTPATPVAGSNGPVAVGQTLFLTASSVPGAAYSWTGPNAFTSTQQNPVIPDVALAAGGRYTVTATVGACNSVPASIVVTVTDCLRCPRTVPFR